MTTLLCYTSTLEGNNVVRLTENTGEYTASNNLISLFDWLIADIASEYRADPQRFKDDTIRFAWDLDDTVALLLRLLPQVAAKTLHLTHKCNMTPYHIFYVPDKIFSITHATMPHVSSSRA